MQRMGIHLSDSQYTALFGHFDRSADGEISYDEFTASMNLSNPKGGTAILPKAITMTPRDLFQFEKGWDGNEPPWPYSS